MSSRKAKKAYNLAVINTILIIVITIYLIFK